MRAGAYSDTKPGAGERQLGETELRTIAAGEGAAATAARKELEELEAMRSPTVVAHRRRAASRRRNRRG